MLFTVSSLLKLAPVVIYGISKIVEHQNLVNTVQSPSVRYTGIHEVMAMLRRMPEFVTMSDEELQKIAEKMYRLMYF